MSEFKKGQKVFVYDGIRKPKRAIIINKYPETFYSNLNLFYVLISGETENTIEEGCNIFENKEKLLDRIEENIDYLKYNYNEIKKGEL